MKSVIIFYSFSGNTKAVAAILAAALRDKGEVDTIELKPLDETSSFIGQCRRAFKKVRAKLENVNFDVSQYDLVCIGTPLWAFAPTPAINTYLDNCNGIAGKETIIFTTRGSGAGNKRCLDYMEELLLKKGAKRVRRFSIQQLKCKDREFVLKEIGKVVGGE
jgi:flavodoxin